MNSSNSQDHLSFFLKFFLGEIIQINLLIVSNVIILMIETQIIFIEIFLSEFTALFLKLPVNYDTPMTRKIV